MIKIVIITALCFLNLGLTQVNRHLEPLSFSSTKEYLISNPDIAKKITFDKKNEITKYIINENMDSRTYVEIAFEKPNVNLLKFLINDYRGKILKNSFDLKSLLKNTNWKKL